MTNLPRYETCVAYYLFFVYSSLSHISFIFSFSNSSLPPAPLSHTLSSSLSPFALFSSHSRIWATTDFLSTITNLICPFTGFFFPLLFALSSLFYLRVAYRVVGLWLQIVGLWLRIMINVGLWDVGISSLFYLESSIRCSSFSERRFAVLSLKVSSIHREPSWFHRFVLHLLRTGKFSIKVLFLCLLFLVTKFESLNLYH